MEYRRFGHEIIIRMDPNEEIMEQLKEVCLKEDIKCAHLTALGAVNDFTVGVYDTTLKQYFSNHFSGVYEIVSLIGNISTMDGNYYAHLHFAAADQQGKVFGGHLNRAVISATCEMNLSIIEGTVDRIKDKKTGLNIYKF